MSGSLIDAQIDDFFQAGPLPGASPSAKRAVSDNFLSNVTKPVIPCTWYLQDSFVWGTRHDRPQEACRGRSAAEDARADDGITLVITVVSTPTPAELCI